MAKEEGPAAGRWFMQNKIPGLTAIALMIYTTLAGTGCFSMIAAKGTFLPIGDVRDGREFNPDSLEKGVQVEMRLRSGSLVKGRVMSVSPLPREDYASRYEAAREALSAEIRLPALGQTVALEDRDGQRFEGLCQGFDRGTLYADLPGRDHTSPLLLARARFLAFGGVQQDADRLRSFLAEGRIPFRRAVALDGGGTALLFPLNEIRDLRIRKSLWPYLILDVLTLGGLVLFMSTSKMDFFRNMDLGWR
jgi:hypothetical protein